MTTLQRVWDDAVKGAERRDWRVGYTGDNAGHVTVPNKSGWYYVRLGAEGSTTVTQARNHPKLGVPPDPDLPIRVRRDNGILTIYGDEALSAGSVPTELGDLADVITGGEESHQVLQYRSADSKWLNQYLALYTGPAQAVTIIGGTISVVGYSHWQVGAESGTSDTLATLSGDQEGHRVVIRAAAGHTILLQTGTGNLSLHNGDCELTSEVHAIELLYITAPARWIELGRSVAASGGGLPYLGGAGIAVTGQTIDIDLATPSGLSLAGDKLALDDSVAGNGLSINSKVMAVNLAVISGLEIVSDALRIRDDVAGDGLTISNKILEVGAGDGIVVAADSVAVRLNPSASGLHFVAGGLAVNVKEGIEIDADELRVDEDTNFDWTGTHTFYSDPQIDANLDFVGSARSITSSGTNHLTLDPGGDLILPSDKTFRSADYADGIPITGFSLFPDPSGDRQLTIFGLKVDELHARAFVADMVRVDIGEEWWGKSLGLLYEDFTTPASIGGTATMVLEDAPAIAGQLFTAGDWVMLRVIDLPAAGTTATATIAYVWGQVSAYVDLVADENGIGRQQWTFTLRDGPFSTLIQKGSVVVCFGVAGQGYIHLSALDSAQGPWIQIGDWNGANPYAPGNRTPRTQIGRLDSLSDPDMTPTGWGLYSDNAYLRGMLRTAETIMDDDGLALLHPAAPSGSFPGNHAALTWWADLNDQTGQPPFRIAAWTDTQNPTEDYDLATLIAHKKPTSAAAILRLTATQVEPTSSASITIDSRDVIVLRADYHVVQGHWLPEIDLAYDLGEASRRWRNLYVDQLFVSGSISGDTLSGAEWEFAGSMIIDANSSGATTVSVTNQGTGTASLSVEGNITLGGTVNNVDINDHVDNPNAHHALATGGDGVTVSGAQVVAVNATVVRTPRTLTAGDGLDGGGDLSANRSFAVDSSVVRTSRVITAGAGLTGGGPLSANITVNVVGGDGITANADDIAVDSTVVRTSRVITAGAGLTGGGDLSADRAFAVNAGAGIQIVGDAVAVGLAADSGLQISGSALLTMGPPSTLTVSSTNLITVNTHSHDIDSTADAYSNPGKILHGSSGVGGLILSALQVRGEVTVTDNGDLWVGAGAYPALYVNNTGDPATANVGVNRIPDPQISLDVSGPLRADFLYGKIGHQLANATMIAHYDGRTPIETNFSGEINGHMGQAATATGGVIHRPGLFGNKAVQIAEGNLNRIINPSFEVNVTTGYSNTSTGGTITQDTEHAYVGSYAAKFARTTGGLLQLRTGSIVVGLANGSTVCAQMRVWADGVAYAQMQIRDGTNAVLRTTTNNTLVDEWEQLQARWTNNTGGPVDIQLYFQNVGPDSGANVWVDAVQVETKTWWTPYTDGALGGYSSTGVADGSAHGWSNPALPHGSNSTRQRAILSYASSGVIHPVHGSVMAWARLEAPANSRVSYLIHHQNGSGRVWVGVDVSNVWFYRLGGTTTRITTAPATAGWHHVCLTWNRGVGKFYLDGALIDTSAYTPSRLNLSATWNLGGDPADELTTLNGYVEDLAWTSDAVDAEEVKEIFSSEAPVIAENSVFSFRATPKGLVWADDEGLWMRDHLGLAVMGFYGGDAAKSWGGLAGPNAMNSGDIFFGRYGAADGGWLRFDRDGSAGSPLLTLGYKEASVFELSSTTAKLQAVNLEITNSTGGEVLGVFATAPTATWGGVTAGAIGDVIIGDMDRGSIVWWDDSLARVVIGSFATGKAWMQLSGGDLSLIRGTERFKLSAGGALLINDSGGNPVFTFNSSLGAEFTLPLTLGTAGGIYQGTGIFGGTVGSGGTIGTGLKIWNSAGIGKLSTYNTGVEQVTLDTDGKFKAGAGAVWLDANGLTLSMGDGYFPSRAIEWQTGGVSFAALSSYKQLASSTETLLATYQVTGMNANTVISAAAPSSLSATVTLQALIGGSQRARALLGDNTAAFGITQLDAAGVRPVLLLSQQDLDQPMMAWSGGTAGAGTSQNFSTDAVGTYRGKIKVTINGTTRWIPFYD